MQTVGPLAPDDLPPALDLEAADGEAGATAAADALTFLATVATLTGRTPVVYTSAAFVARTFPPRGLRGPSGRRRTRAASRAPAREPSPISIPSTAPSRSSRPSSPARSSTRVPSAATEALEKPEARPTQEKRRPARRRAASTTGQPTAAPSSTAHRSATAKLRPTRRATRARAPTPAKAQDAAAARQGRTPQPRRRHGSPSVQSRCSAACDAGELAKQRRADRDPRPAGGHGLVADPRSK